MHDFSDRQSVQPSDASQKKRLGGYLVEAGLLTPAQVDVALNDQKLTGMRFGEILAARGWVKQQTIEYLMHKVVVPEQMSATNAYESEKAQQASIGPGTGATSHPHPLSSEANKQPIRRHIPISKPLPSVGQSDSDISWVG